MNYENSEHLLNSLNATLSPLGYSRSAGGFWRIERGFFQLVDLQPGAHGNYFFVNVGLHPQGFPKLLSDKLVIPERPKEYECIIRKRVDQITNSTSLFRENLVSPEDQSAIDVLDECLSTDVQQWILKWSKFETIALTSVEDLKQVVNAVPILKTRACAMLKYFCLVQIKDFENARQLLTEVESTPTGKWSFDQVDHYLSSLLSE